MKNIDIFHSVVGFIFSELYDNIPHEIEIEYSDFHETFPDAQEDDCTPWIDTFNSAIKWLEVEEFIKTNKKSDEAEGFKFMLTGKGMHQLSMLGESKEDKTIGDLLLEAVENGNLTKTRQYGKVAIYVSFNTGNSNQRHQ